MSDAWNIRITTWCSIGSIKILINIWCIPCGLARRFVPISIWSIPDVLGETSNFYLELLDKEVAICCILIFGLLTFLGLNLLHLCLSWIYVNHIFTLGNKQSKWCPRRFIIEIMNKRRHTRWIWDGSHIDFMIAVVSGINSLWYRILQATLNIQIDCLMFLIYSIGIGLGLLIYNSNRLDIILFYLFRTPHLTFFYVFGIFSFIFLNKLNNFY